jgi:enoyl-CoA hydratase
VTADRADARVGAGNRRGGIGARYGPDAIRICLDRPPVNALTVDMLRGLGAILAAAREDPRPVLLTGASGIFSAGFDIKQPAPDQQTIDAAAQRVLAATQEHTGLVVAAVEGAAVGLGLLVAASADVLVVSRTARIRMPEVRLGIAADIRPLRRFLSDAWIRRLSLLGEQFTAEQLQLGCAGAVLCEPGGCADRAEEILAAATDTGAAAIQMMKRQLARPS